VNTFKEVTEICLYEVRSVVPLSLDLLLRFNHTAF